MILLDWRENDRDGEPAVITLVFGAGLIGSAIITALSRLYTPRTSHHPFSWHEPHKQADELAAILQQLKAIAGQPGENPVTVHVIWSAGKGGFYSDSETLESELTGYGNVLKFAEKLGNTIGNNPVHFHLFSSAGGLFEGIRLVDSQTTPSPRRPYGMVKLQQENMLNSSEGKLTRKIYRPSTVYGFTGHGGRSGLIPTLLANAFLGKQSCIFAHPETLRDYVYTADIGRFIATEINSKDDQHKVFTLCSGKSTSIFELIGLIERIMNRKLLINYQTGTDNFLHNSFSSELKPKHWQTTNLEQSIRSIAHTIKNDKLKLKAHQALA